MRKKSMTVYELIQKLTEFEPDTELVFHAWATHEQVDMFKEEWAKDDWVGMYCYEVDDISINYNNLKQVIVDIYAEDL